MAKKKVRLGQYYTPAPVADWITSLARTPLSGRVLEAGYGEGAFLQALLDRGYSNITGYDIDPRNHEVVQSRFGQSVDAQLQDFLLAPRRADWDLVIGNPPYVRWANLDPSARQTLQKDPFWKQYSSGEWDLLYAFLLGGVEMLRPGGEMIFIVPYNWFSATYAEPVRKHLQENGHFSDIIHFGEYRVFPDAAPNAIVFRWEKSPSRKKIHVVDFLGRTGKSSEIINRIEGLRAGLRRGKEVSQEEWRSFRTQQFQGSGPWSLLSEAEGSWAESLESASETLGEVADVGVGIVSGLDRAFLLEGTKGFSREERQWIRPFVKARNCQHFRVDKPSLFIWADEIEQESELRKFRGIYQHLLPHKQALLDRYGADPERWWHWATVRNLDLFQKNIARPKIFVPCADRSAQARFSITTSRYMGSGDVLLVAPSMDPWLLQAWLGSRAFSHWYSIRGPQTGQRRRYTQAFLETVPVPPLLSLPGRDQKVLRDNAQSLSKKRPAEKLLEQNEKILGRLLG